MLRAGFVSEAPAWTSLRGICSSRVESEAAALDLSARNFGHSGWVCGGALAAEPSVLTPQPEDVGI